MFESLALDQKKAIAVVCAAVLLLDDEPERPNKPRVGQEVLPSDPKTESTWATIWAKGDDRTLVKLINLDRPAFLKLLPSQVEGGRKGQHKKILEIRIRISMKCGSVFP